MHDSGEAAAVVESWPSAQCDSDRQHRLLTAASARETGDDDDDERRRRSARMTVHGLTDRQTDRQIQIARSVYAAHARPVPMRLLLTQCWRRNKVAVTQTPRSMCYFDDFLPTFSL